MSNDDTLRPPAWLHHDGDEAHIVREVMRTYQSLTYAFTREVGMPSSRLGLMRLLATCEEGELGVLEIARRLGINAAAVTRQVQEMEAAGLIARSADRLDKRRSRIRLTDNGRSTFAELHRCAHEFERQLGGAVSAEDLATAVRVLGAVREALQALP